MLNRKIEGVALTYNNIATQLMFTSNSGKIIYRDKIDTLIGIKHPGIILGDDIYGITWVIHNHYQIGYPEIVTLETFAIGVTVLNDNRTVNYNREEIVNRAIASWQNKKQYDWLWNNCQHFVNEVTQGKRNSETLNRVGNNLILAGLAKTAIGTTAKSKPLANIGVAIAVVGLVVKLFGNQ
jgi:hypothetical protein